MIFIHLFLVSNYLDTNRRYSTNLTDNQWHIENNLKPTKRKRGNSLGDIMDTLGKKLRIAFGRKDCLGLRVLLRILRSHGSNRLFENHTQHIIELKFKQTLKRGKFNLSKSCKILKIWLLYFVTTFCIAKNMYSNRVQSEVLLDDLFA